MEFSDDTKIEIDIMTGNILEHEEDHESMSDEFLENFLRNLLLTNLVILLLAAILSYFLAGKTLAPIQRKIQQQDQFVADAAHELRNPLAGILLTLENILHEKNSHEKDIKNVLRETLRLSKITEDPLIHAKQKE